MKKIFTLLAAFIGLSMFMSASAYEHTWKFVTAGDGSTYAIDADGSLWGWGWNESGQLGLGTGSEERTAVPMKISDEKWSFVASGQAYAFFIKEDGTLWAAGDNSKGVQGTGDGQSHKELIQIGTDNDWKYVTATRFFGHTAFAIKTDGTLWGWGEGEFGALGTGNFSNKPTPVQIGTDTDWVEVSVGVSHGMGIKADGSMWMWGWNERGQLSTMTDGTGSNFVKTPKQFGTETDWVKVFAVNQSSYAIKKDGSLWAWGYNNDDLLFGYQSNDTMSIKEPRKLDLEGKVTFISGCENVRVVGIGENGVTTKVLAWGNNNDGALGDGKGVSIDLAQSPISYYPVEVKLPAGIKITQLASGQRYTNVLTEEGRIYAWGTNRAGQLGNLVARDQMTFSTTPLISGEVVDTDGTFTFDATAIPSGVSSAKKLILTGEWDTKGFQALTLSIGNNAGFPPAGNTSIEEVDMSQITVAPNTSMYVELGTSMNGVFQGCRSIKTVKMPAADQAANFVSLRSAFQNCSSLEAIDLTGCKNVTSFTDTFFGCASLKSADISNCESIASSESMFDCCTSIETIILPKSLVIEKFFFGDNQALRLIDWSRFEGTEVPQFTTSVFWDVFQYINDLSVITLIVPDAAVSLFTNDANWSRLNVKGATGVSNSPKDNVARDVYNFKGQYITTLKPGVNAADVLGNGLYIVGGEKMIIRK